MLLDIIIIISSIKHQHDNLAEFSRDTKLLFITIIIMSVPLIFLVIFIILFSKPTARYYFQAIILMSFPQPHNYNFLVAPKCQHCYLVPMQ